MVAGISAALCRKCLGSVEGLSPSSSHYARYTHLKHQADQYFADDAAKAL